MAADARRPGRKGIRKNINNVVVSGNLTMTPELVRLPNDRALATLFLGSTALRKEAGGGYCKHPNQFDALVFDAMAENCCRWLRRGAAVTIEGQLESYKEVVPSTGHTVKGVRILARYVEFGPIGSDAPYEIRERAVGQPRTRSQDRAANQSPAPATPKPPEGGWPW